MMLAKVAPAPITINTEGNAQHINVDEDANKDMKLADRSNILNFHQLIVCLLYTSPSPRDAESSRMPSSA